MTTVRVADPGAWSRTVLADRRVQPATRGQAQETTRRLIAGSLAGMLVLVRTSGGDTHDSSGYAYRYYHCE